MLKTLLSFVALLLFFSQGPVTAQALHNDGFQRRNGQMYVLRNGQARPMLRDARLPTGAVVTKDGFVMGADGKRTELREGQGCDLKGNPVAVVSSSSGGLALSAPARRTVARTSAVSARRPAVEEVRAVLHDLLGGGSRAEERDEYGEKYEEKVHEQRKKEEEWQREERKRWEEYERERGKKWKEKKKGKRWDD